MREPDRRHTRRFFFAAFWMDLSGGMYVVALPYLAMRLGAESLGLGVIGGLRTCAYMVAIILLAGLADRHSRRTITLISTVSLGCLLLVSAAVTELWQLGATVVLWSVALSLYWPSVFSWLGDSHPPEELGRATGTVNVGWSIGSMVSAGLAGWLFELLPILPILLAAGPALLAGASLRGVAGGRRADRKASPAGPAPAGARRRLIAAWLGNGALCCLFGLMMNVFPMFGKTIGVTPTIFGGLIALVGLVRTGVFVMGGLGASWPRDWRLSLFVQVAAAALVALTGVVGSCWWAALVFASLGLGMGLSYYVSLYASLEGEGSRGIKSGLHEAALMGGLMLGAVGGGVVAHRWGLRAPYAPVAGLALVIVIAQMLLQWSARRAESRGVASGERAA